MSIGARIRQARKREGLSQVDLAARVRVTQPTIANWELGVHDPRQLMLAKLAETLGVSRRWLAEGERSEEERDKHPAAAYLRRPLNHAPVISWRSTAQMIAPHSVDIHELAEDYIPITSKRPTVFCVFADDPVMAREFPKNTLAVIDHSLRAPSAGQFVVATDQPAPILRLWRDDPARLITAPLDGAGAETPCTAQHRIIGTVIYSIRFF